MKKLYFLLLVAIGLGFTASAQQKKPITVKIQTPGMQCDECKKRVEDYLKYEEGVTKVVAWPKSKYVSVTYLADRTNIENIKTAIANVGYDADDVKADEDAYKKLPKTCKRVEDGGHKKGAGF
jgi:periplasmic mercuric ion binding protein